MLHYVMYVCMHGCTPVAIEVVVVVVVVAAAAVVVVVVELAGNERFIRG